MYLRITFSHHDQQMFSHLSAALIAETEREREGARGRERERDRERRERELWERGRELWDLYHTLLFNVVCP